MPADFLQNFNPDPDAPAQVDTVRLTENYISGGSWARMLLDNNLDPAVMRPYVEKNNSVWVTRHIQNADGDWVAKAFRVNNDANATLRYNDWLDIDKAVITAAQPRLSIVADIRSRGLEYNLPFGIAKTVLQYQQQSNITGATMSMSGLRESEGDRPVWSIVQMPLPLIHKDFSFDYRELLASRTGASPLDLTTAKLAGRRVYEQVEQLALGVTNNLFLGQSTYTWGGNTLYGLANFPQRITYSLTLPTTPGYTPEQTLDDVLSMRAAARAEFHFGPYMLYTGQYWDKYMDSDYKPTYNSMTLRERLGMVDGIEEVKTVDYITDQTMILVEMQPETVEMVIGQEIITIQYPSHGGFQSNFKVMCLIVPRVRADINGNSGIIVGS